MSCDYFLDALGDPDFALKIRERRRRMVADAKGEMRRLRKIAVVVLKAVRLPSQTKKRKGPQK